MESSVLNDFYKYQAKTSPTPLGIEVSKASGSYIYDKNGKIYLDFIAGVSTCNLGHCHPKIIKAIKVQIEKYLLVMIYGEFAQDSSTLLCKEIINILPKNHESVYLTNSGTEAIEGAIKLARKYSKRSKLIAANNSYHGSTYGALSLLGEENQKKGYYPMLPDVRFINFNSIEDINLIDNETAAVVLETIQGGAGFILPKKNYLKKIKKKCVEVGALLILDEIQPGFGRTGKFFGFEHYGISPDIIVMGKGMGGGLPVGAFTSSRKIMKCFENKPKFGHITTFGGNPVIAAASLATLKEIKNGSILNQISKKEKLFRTNLKHNKIKKINGKGLMLALIMESSEVADLLVKKCLENGLLLFWLLWEKKAVRISPALNISDIEINKGCAIIIKVLNIL